MRTKPKKMHHCMHPMQINFIHNFPPIQNLRLNHNDKRAYKNWNTRSDRDGKRKMDKYEKEGKKPTTISAHHR